MTSRPHGRGGALPGLAASRLWAATRFPYLATGVFGATVIAEPDSGTVSVDESWRMHADPELVAEWTPAQLGSVLVHHVCHLLRTHGERARAAGVGPDDTPAWLRAADAEINDDLVPAGLDLPGQPILPRHLGFADGLLAEQYYAPGAHTGAARWLNCGGGADGQPGDCGCPGGLPGWQSELLRRQVAHDVIAHAKQAGNVPAGMLRWAEQTLSPRVDWRRQLAAELRRAVSEVSGAVDYSYRRPSRRSSVSGDVILPALRRPVPEIAVVCDTSGSMSDDLLAMVLAEVEGIVRALGRARATTRTGLRHRSRDGAADQLRAAGVTRGRRRNGHGSRHPGSWRATATPGRLRRAHRRPHTMAGRGAEGHASRRRPARRNGTRGPLLGTRDPGAIRGTQCITAPSPDSDWLLAHQDQEEAPTGEGYGRRAGSPGGAADGKERRASAPPAPSR